MVDYPFAGKTGVNIARQTTSFDSGWLLSEMHRATGSVNFPQLLNKLETKTGQVRNLFFRREGIENKSFKNTKANNSTTISGPGVSFGYEDGTNTTTETTGTAPKGGAAGSLGVNVKYHNEYPDMNIFPLKALQTPITSFGGGQGRVGYREEGKCKFYVPSRGYVRNYTGFMNEFNFRQIEPQDKLIDVDRISYAFQKSSLQEGLPVPNVHPDAGAPISSAYGTASGKAMGHLHSSGGFSYQGPAGNLGMNAERLLTGADCKRLRIVLEANYGLYYNGNIDIIETPESSSPALKKYTWDNTYLSLGEGPYSFDAVLSTVGLAFIVMSIDIPDEAAVDNSGTAYASRASDDKARTYTNYRRVYGHWTFTAPDNVQLEQNFRTSGSLGGAGNWEKFDFIHLPVGEPFILDLPFYDVEVGDTRTINVYGRKYIATFGCSTRKPGHNFGGSSGGNNTTTTRWSDGTQTETSAGQVGASWDIERLVFNSSGNRRGEVNDVSLGLMRTGGIFTTTDYLGTTNAATGSGFTIPEGLPMKKVFIASAASAVGATSISADDGSGDGSDVASDLRSQTGTGSRGPDKYGNGAPIFNTSGDLIGHAKSIDSNGTITLQEPALIAINDNQQLSSYPWIYQGHWADDIIAGVSELEVHEIYLYEDAEWVVDSIKDYRDEYQQINCTKVRGSRHSRRLANG